MKIHGNYNHPRWYESLFVHNQSGINLCQLFLYVTGDIAHVHLGRVLFFIRKQTNKFVIHGS